MRFHASDCSVRAVRRFRFAERELVRNPGCRCLLGDSRLCMQGEVHRLAVAGVALVTVGLARMAAVPAPDVSSAHWSGDDHDVQARPRKAGASIPASFAATPALAGPLRVPGKCSVASTCSHQGRERNGRRHHDPGGDGTVPLRQLPRVAGTPVMLPAGARHPAARAHGHRVDPACHKITRSISASQPMPARTHHSKITKTAKVQMTSSPADSPVTPGPVRPRSQVGRCPGRTETDHRACSEPARLLARQG